MATMTRATTAAATNNIVSFDVSELVQLLQVHLPQLRLEAIVYEHKAQMEDNKEQYRLLCKEADSLRKKLSSILQDNDACRKAQERMEAQLYAQQQELAEAQREIQQLTKQKRDLEKRLEIELHSYESDRLMWHQRETELCSELKRRAQDGWRCHGQQPRRTRSATASNVWNRDSLAVIEETQKWNDYGATTALQIKDTKTRAQERLLADFAAQVEQQKRIIEDAVLTTKAQASRVEELEKELFSVKQLNASLMEDNESYQTLLREKTMTGEFLKKVEEEQEQQEENQPSTLAAELGKTTSGHPGNNENETVTKLAEEVRTLQESNKALTLYMNKILMKIVDNQELVDILNIDVDEDEQQQQLSGRPDDSKQPVVSIDSSSVTKSTESNLAKQSNTRPRRSTISSWISTPKQSVATESPTVVVRHRSQTNAGQTTSSGGSGGWSRALKRMTAVL